MTEGWLSLRLLRDGRVIDGFDEQNLVLSGASQVSAQNIGGVTAGNSIALIGYGSNASPPAVGNTVLSTDAYIKAVGAITFPAPNQVAVQISLGNFESNGLIISEYGLMTANGTLIARLVRNKPLPKDQSFQIQATWTLNF